MERTEPDFRDEHAGHGGSYVIDPATGRRSLVERTGWTPAPEAPAPSDPPAPAPKAKK